MWLAKILSVKRNPSRSEAVDTTGTPLTIAELSKQRDTAIKNMVASIAAHDFMNARRYSDEETRIKRILQDLESGISTDRKQDSVMKRLPASIRRWFSEIAAGGSLCGRPGSSGERAARPQCRFGGRRAITWAKESA
jgi:hypothetical protein